MRKLKADGEIFQHLDYARYATDVTFQQPKRQSKNPAERNTYFFVKHKFYGYKVEHSVLSIGVYIACTKHLSKATADLKKFRKNHNFHMKASKKKLFEILAWLIVRFYRLFKATFGLF